MTSRLTEIVCACLLFTLDKRVLETSVNNIFCWEVLGDTFNVLFCWCCMITPWNKLIFLCCGMKGRYHADAPSLMLERHFDSPAVFTFSYLSCIRCIKLVSLFPLYFFGHCIYQGCRVDHYLFWGKYVKWYRIPLLSISSLSNVPTSNFNFKSISFGLIRNSYLLPVANLMFLWSHHEHPNNKKGRHHGLQYIVWHSQEVWHNTFSKLHNMKGISSVLRFCAVPYWHAHSL